MRYAALRTHRLEKEVLGDAVHAVQSARHEVRGCEDTEHGVKGRPELQLTARGTGDAGWSKCEHCTRTHHCEGNARRARAA
jgi:hypothetical protein